MNRLKKLLIALLTILITLLATLVHAAFISPKTIHYQNISLYSNKIDDSLENIQILFFADLDYGEFFDQTRLDKAIHAINAADCDLIIFGGDIFSNQVSVDDAMIETITNALASLKAPLGKFYVTGEKDTINGSEDIVHSIMHNAQFECINDTVLPIRNGDVPSIQLVGISNMITSSPNINELYNQLNPNDFTLAICHTPDIAPNLPSGIDRMIAADSHGGQIYIPLLGGLYETTGCQNYQHGTIELTNFKMDINSGLGTTIIDARLNAPPTITIYTLRSGIDNTN